MKNSTQIKPQIKPASRFARSLRAGTGILALASMIPFTLAASAADKHGGHGAAPAHKVAAGALAVVGVMMEPGETNIALEEVWNHLPKKAGKPTRIGGVAANARDLLPHKGSYHHYKGSLTTPPCSEGVNWFVLTKPVQVSAAQIGKFTDIVGSNARPAQSAHNRLVISEK